MWTAPKKSTLGLCIASICKLIIAANEEKLHPERILSETAYSLFWKGSSLKPYCSLHDLFGRWQLCHPCPQWLADLHHDWTPRRKLHPLVWKWMTTTFEKWHPHTLHSFILKKKAFLALEQYSIWIPFHASCSSQDLISEFFSRRIMLILQVIMNICKIMHYWK